MANPSAWFPLLFFIGYEAFFIPFGNTFWSILLSSPAWLGLILGLALNAAASAAPAAVPAVVGAAGIPAEQAGGMPAAGLASTGVGAATTAGSAPATGTMATAAPAVTPAAGFAYIVGGIGPDGGPGPTLIDRKGAKAPGRYIPAAAAVGAVSREKSRLRRRRRAEMRDYADEYADMDSDLASRR